MNAFLFCTRFPELVRCTLVGANQYGKMAWVVTTPGRELESLDDFMEGACELQDIQAGNGHRLLSDAPNKRGYFQGDTIGTDSIF